MIIKEIIETVVKSKYDVAVCGGDFAGISAALAAARHGSKVVLFEKQYMLGGLGTAGIVTIYLPLCDGYGKQVSFGIAEELLRLSILHGAEDRYPENWLDDKGTRGENDKRFEVQYNPQLFAILAEKLLLDAGVEILYGTYAVDVKMQNDKISQIRMTRKLVGEYILSDKETHKYFEDSIGMVSNWKKRGPIYEVPFGTLYNSAVKNLICAGRCISVNETMWDIMRVIPCCAVTGQAAGSAASMTDDFSTLNIKELQKVLKFNGVVLHENEL